jgi:hypothetical protein
MGICESISAAMMAVIFDLALLKSLPQEGSLWWQPCRLLHVLQGNVCPYNPTRGFSTKPRHLKELRPDRKSVLPLLKKISDRRGQSLIQ